MSSRLSYLEAQNYALRDDSRMARLEAENSDLLHKLSDLQKRESQLRNELDREFSLRNALGELDRDLPGELDSSISNHNAAHGEHEGNTAPGDDDGKLQLEQLNRDLLKENSELLQRMLELQVENATYRDKKELQPSTASDPQQLPNHRRIFANPFRWSIPGGNTLDLSRRSWSVGLNPKLKGAGQGDGCVGLDAITSASSHPCLGARSQPCLGAREVPTGI